jgi:hypothetical protein
MKTEFDSMPPAVVREGNVLRLFFGFEPVEKTDPMTEEAITKFQGYNVNVEGDHSYGGIVSAIIRDKFPDSRKDAILANRELVRDDPEHPKSEEYMAEYLDFQDWRIYAKSVAQSVIDNTVE